MGFRLSSAARRFVDDLVAEEIGQVATIIAFQPPADPFKLDHDCANPEGHDPKRIGRSFVCVHCSKVFGL
jgi:hypothetical protein